jgi:hypothetical protein
MPEEGVPFRKTARHFSIPIRPCIVGKQSHLTRARSVKAVRLRCFSNAHLPNTPPRKHGPTKASATIQGPMGPYKTDPALFGGGHTRIAGRTNHACIALNP